MTFAEMKTVGRWTGLAILASLLIGIINAMIVSAGIDVNLSGDIGGTAAAMSDAGQRLEGRGWILMILFLLEVVAIAGLYLMVRDTRRLAATSALLLGAGAALIGLVGALSAFNIAALLANGGEASRISTLIAREVAADYSSFHLSLVIASIAKACIYWIFVLNRRLPRLISGFGLFASGLVAVAIVARDFIPFLGSDAVTTAFMASNFVAIVATGLYMAIRGVAPSSTKLETNEREAR
ncbi:DUF4386 family protein [Altererythrobacter sp. MF3-039]|uniref:DUF4386 family protein n=1 Tax=Altererythrobacter sp. MF3-039 TaxID=3252901 RepID=UPI00390C8BDD